jgi:uncharacterized protein (DUF488 family)
MSETGSLQKIKFYTTSYVGMNIDYLKPMINGLDAVLVDVRFSPISVVLRWRHVYLKTLLREKYHHVAQLGSRAFRQGKAQIQNLNLGIQILVSFNANAVLMCECADPKECHRLIISQELQRKGFEVEELKNWKLIDT